MLERGKDGGEGDAGRIKTPDRRDQRAARQREGDKQSDQGTRRTRQRRRNKLLKGAYFMQDAFLEGLPGRRSASTQPAAMANDSSQLR